MLAILRETLLSRLEQTSKLVNLYRSAESDYVASVVEWLESVEADLSRLKSPLVSLCSSERAKILAALDGFRDPQAMIAERSPRKFVRGTATLALSRVEEALRGKVLEIDGQLAQLGEKIAQLLAASSAETIPLPPTSPRASWLRQIWDNLGAVPEARALHTYLAARLGPTDREYLLSEIIENGGWGSS